MIDNASFNNKIQNNFIANITSIIKDQKLR